MSEELLDCLGRRRSPAATSAFHSGRPPASRGLRYPARPSADRGDHRSHARRRYWRVRRIAASHDRRPVGAGLRIGEALALAETDLDPARGAITIRRGKGGKRERWGWTRFGWEHLDAWVERRRELPVGLLFCVLDGCSRGQPWNAPAVRNELLDADPEGPNLPSS